MSRRTNRIAIYPFLLLAGLAAATVPGSASGATESANLVASIGAKSGSLTKLDGNGYRLILEVDSGRTKVRSIENGGLLGAKPVAFRQETNRYIATWKDAFAKDSRVAAIAIERGGDVLSLKLSSPRFNRGKSKVTFTARKRPLMTGAFGRYRGQDVNRVSGAFGPATLKVNDNGWTKVWAHLNAYRDYGSCNGEPIDPVFSCQSTGERGGMVPWRGDSSFGSTRGGMDFHATGNDALGNWDTGDKYGVTSKLIGSMDWGWKNDALTITDQSTYSITDLSCEKHPVSGTDRSLTGLPGGPLHVSLNEAGEVFTGTGYVIDIQGYLSEAFFVQARCGS